MKQESTCSAKALAILLLCIFTAFQVKAQNTGTITGTVVDNLRESVIGASVLLKGTTNGTITDIDGNFSLSNIPDEGILQISFIGYKTMEVPVNKQKKITVQLMEDSQALDEVVVVGYGVQRKSDLTGAVASVKAAEALKSTPTGNVSDALQGRLAGVAIVSSGDPSKDASIRVRGVNSVSADSGPLVVIDGFIEGSLQSLNPSDIQSIEVLKDASATAVYGSRGANGVILVTTKTPNKDRLSVSLNAFVNFKTSLALPDRLSAGEYAEMANAYGKEYNESAGSPVKTYYTPEQIDAFRNGENTFDYVKAIFDEPAITQNYDLSIAGGGEKTTFLASFRYEGNNGIIKQSRKDIYNWRLKVDTNIKKWLKAGVNFWGDYRETSGPRIAEYEGVLSTAINYPSVIMPTDENGNYNNITPLSGSPLYNPLGNINEMDGKNQTVTNRLQGYVDFIIAEGLTFRSQLGVTFANNLVTTTNNKKSYTAFKNGNTPSASASTKWAFGWLNTNTLNYIKEFNKNHRINATAVFEQSYNNDYMLKGEGNNLLFDKLGANALSWSERLSTSSGRTITGLLSGLLRVNYVLMNRYALTASIRADGSSRLADKWDYFPSAAAAWTISNEPFMEQIDFVSQLKLRAGYGSVGNQAVEPYRIYSKMVPTNLNGITSFTVGRPASPLLRWERNDQINIGLDMGFLDGRLTASVDWYNKKSKDILLEVEQAVHTGWNSLLKNAGEIENKGFEITIGADPVVKGNWRWHTDITLSHNKGKYTKIPTRDKMQAQAGAYANGIFKMIEGEKLSTFWGYHFDGVWKSDEVSQTTTVTKADGTKVTDTYAKIYKVKPGEAKYTDVNNDGVYDINDQGIIGNGQPAFSWGWNNTVSFRDFDLSIFVIGVHGFDIYNVNKFSSIDAVPTKVFIRDRWTKDHEDTDIPGFVKAGNTSVNGNTSRNVEKGDFVKVKNITLGYTLPKGLCDKLYLTNLRFYGSIQNPFHFSGYSGLDPEVALNSPMTSGVDWEAYPNGRNYVLGINVSF